MGHDVHNGSRGVAEKAGQPSIRQTIRQYALTVDNPAALLLCFHQVHTTPHHQMYYVCRMTEDGMWEGLRSTTDQDYAEAIVDFYCEKWPHAYVDILSYDEYHGGKAKWKQMEIA
jgi:hypothetical protein